MVSGNGLIRPETALSGVTGAEGSASEDSFEAVLPDLTQLVRSGDRIVWGQGAAQPVFLTRALSSQRHALARVSVFMGVGSYQTPGPDDRDAIDFVSYCGSGTNRKLSAIGALDIWPCHYSELPAAIRGGRLKMDVVMLLLSPPDEFGRCSLGLANEYLAAAIDSARIVIAEINPNVPWTFGDKYIHMSEIDLVVETDYQLPYTPGKLSDTDMSISRHVAGLVEDGATLQVGLGNIPEAVMSQLTTRKNLGVHSGVIGNGLVALQKSGALTNAFKGIDPGVSVAGLVMGSHDLHAFLHQNREFRLCSTDYTHNPNVLAKLNSFIAINSAVEVDLTGQVNAEVAAGEYVGAVGGALDFFRAARQSERGIPIIALPSLAGSRSRIVASLSGPVSTPRSDAAVVVTEFGVADLRGQTLSERIKRLIDVAHPSHREAIEREAFELTRGIVRTLG